jgi:hypothetical protein
MQIKRLDKVIVSGPRTFSELMDKTIAKIPHSAVAVTQETSGTPDQSTVLMILSLYTDYNHEYNHVYTEYNHVYGYGYEYS